MVRVRLARGGNSSENSPHYREAKKSINVRGEIEKSFDSTIRIFDAGLAGSTAPLDDQVDGDTSCHRGSNEKRGRQLKDRLAGVVSPAVLTSTLPDSPLVRDWDI